MPAVSRFMFYTDPVAQTGGSEVTIDWAGQTFTLPGPATYPFACADEVVSVIRLFADQSTADGIAETRRDIYKADGTIQMTVSCALAAGTPPTVANITPGGVSTYDVVKAKDLADGLEQYVLEL